MDDGMKTWEEIHQEREWGTYPEVYMVRQVKAFLRGLCRQDSEFWPLALDIGCGIGAHSCMLEQEGFDVVATDISQTAIQRLMKRHRFCGTAVVHDITSEQAPISYDSRTQYDFILDNLSLTHVKDAPVDRIKSWLRPGGWMVSAVFTEPPDGVPQSWPHQIGEVVEEHAITRAGKRHVIQLQRYVKV